MACGVSKLCFREDHEVTRGQTITQHMTPKLHDAIAENCHQPLRGSQRAPLHTEQPVTDRLTD